MIDVYTANTTNAQRASIAMLESGLAFTTHHIDLYQSQHRTPEYLAVNPNGTVPAMTDHDGPRWQTQSHLRNRSALSGIWLKSPDA